MKLRAYLEPGCICWREQLQGQRHGHRSKTEVMFLSLLASPSPRLLQPSLSQEILSWETISNSRTSSHLRIAQLEVVYFDSLSLSLFLAIHFSDQKATILSCFSRSPSSHIPFCSVPIFYLICIRSQPRRVNFPSPDLSSKQTSQLALLLLYVPKKYPVIESSIEA